MTFENQLQIIQHLAAAITQISNPTAAYNEIKQAEQLLVNQKCDEYYELFNCTSICLATKKVCPCGGNLNQCDFY